MESRTKKDAGAADHEALGPEDEAQKRHEAELDSATLPASGAAVQHAFAGAELSGEERARDTSETADALKRAAENDARV